MFERTECAILIGKLGATRLSADFVGIVALALRDRLHSARTLMASGHTAAEILVLFLKLASSVG